MASVVIQIGEKLHIITRRLFAEDIRRHFAGEVVAAGEAHVRVDGYAFVFDSSSNSFQKRPGRRIRVFPLDATNIVNVIPRDVDLDALRYGTSPERHLVVTDGGGFALDINEFGTLG